ncbi:class I SAM-dependent methyltransferase [Alkalimarinus coralli]|uniref:class I SAM-dependent methyltransferase n=1 Tax=Alkalimarinus coralli TaxID=2935863 RepID=UPI00202BA148|nr:methyltransferase domain-containing protein [Alkalimarinus coralli]
MDALSDTKILDSWQKNVPPWMKAVQNKQIETRRLVTDQAIIEAVRSVPARSVLDIGCGEGWLVRELSKLGLSVTGVDAISGFIDNAKSLGDGTFKVLEYEAISNRTLAGRYDIAVCNFSLIGKTSVEHIFKVAPSILNTNGHFIVQTLHPAFSGGNMPYRDGWREGSWEGFSDEFTDPAPWYFRTTESWCDLFINNGLELRKMIEPINPKTGKAASLILIGRSAA